MPMQGVPAEQGKQGDGQGDPRVRGDETMAAIEPIEARTNLRDKLPMSLPKHPCPICGSKVYIIEVNEWGTDEGEIVGAAFECETEPDIDSDEWEEWFHGHYSMPYVDWLPWENKVMTWLNQHYYYSGPET
jgi:hypothetical protein